MNNEETHKSLRELDAQVAIAAYGWVWAEHNCADHLTALVPPDWLEHKAPSVSDDNKPFPIWLPSDEDAPRYNNWYKWPRTTFPHFTTNMNAAHGLMHRIREMWRERGYSGKSKSNTHPLPYWHIVSIGLLPRIADVPGWSVQIRADNATFSWPVIMPVHDELPTAITKVALKALENMDNMMELMRIKRRQFEAQRGY